MFIERITWCSVALLCNVSKNTVCWQIRREGIHPYHFRTVQSLNKFIDHNVCFFLGVSKQLRNIPSFLQIIFCPVEAKFPRTGITHVRNMHYKIDENHWFRSSRFQEQNSITAWASIIDDRLNTLAHTLNATIRLDLRK